MGKRLKVLALFDSGVPKPRGHGFRKEFKRPDWRSECEVVWALRRLGHNVRMLALCEDLEPLKEEVRDFEPDVAFNMMEEFDHDSGKVPDVVAALRKLRVPCTGSGTAGLRLAKDKALAKRLLVRYGVPTPAFRVLERGRALRRPRGLSFPVVVKPRMDDASYGIAAASVVESDRALRARVRFLHENGHDALVEEYAEGREFYASVLGRRVFPLREVRFGLLGGRGRRPLATYKVKWDPKYRKRNRIRYFFAKDVPPPVFRRIASVSREACRALRVRGYARVDVRAGPGGRPTVLEVNPNPYLGRHEDFAQAAKRGGLPFEKLLQAILKDALS